MLETAIMEELQAYTSPVRRRFERWSSRFISDGVTSLGITPDVMVCVPLFLNGDRHFTKAMKRDLEGGPVLIIDGIPACTTANRSFFILAKIDDEELVNNYRPTIKTWVEDRLEEMFPNLVEDPDQFIINQIMAFAGDANELFGRSVRDEMRSIDNRIEDLRTSSSLLTTALNMEEELQEIVDTLSNLGFNRIPSITLSHVTYDLNMRLSVPVAQSGASYYADVIRGRLGSLYRNRETLLSRQLILDDYKVTKDDLRWEDITLTGALYRRRDQYSSVLRLRFDIPERVIEDDEGGWLIKPCTFNVIVGTNSVGMDIETSFTSMGEDGETVPAVHPHIGIGGNPCWGNSAVPNFIRELNMPMVMLSLDQYLKSYNASDAYHHPSEELYERAG